MARGETGRMHVSSRPSCSAARFGLWLPGLVCALAVAPVAGAPTASPTAQVKQAVGIVGLSLVVIGPNITRPSRTEK